MTVVIDGRSLTVADMVAVGREHEPVALAPAAIDSMAAARRALEGAVAAGHRIYGVSTAAGALQRVELGASETRDFNRLMLQNCRVGMGRSSFPRDRARHAASACEQSRPRDHRRAARTRPTDRPGGERGLADRGADTGLGRSGRSGADVGADDPAARHRRVHTRGRRGHGGDRQQRVFDRHRELCVPRPRATRRCARRRCRAGDGGLSRQPVDPSPHPVRAAVCRACRVG